MQLVQVVLALLGGGPLRRQRWRGQERQVQRRCGPPKGVNAEAGRRQGAQGRLRLTAPALPGRASPTWLSVQQGGLNDLLV